jgi:phosphohistidine phosphatase
VLYLLRHGIAAERNPVDYPDDSNRPLTLRGLEKLKRVLDHLQEMEVECQRILSSPYRRARQTAEQAGRKLGAPVELCSELEPGGDFQSYPWATLQGDTMVVGHEPDLSRLGSWFLTGSAEPVFQLKKAGVACLERDRSQTSSQAPPRYVLQWLLIPKLWAK